MAINYKVIDVLTVFMFHKVTEPPMLQEFEKFLIYLKGKYNIVMPGDKVSIFKKSACLTFDDAYFDFYEYVFPLLKKYNIPVVLAVPAAFILDDTIENVDTRLSFKISNSMSGNNYLKSPFCTWKELQEMSDTGLVEMSSHHYTHASVKNENFDFCLEVQTSKQIIEDKLGINVRTLIYPHGHFNRIIHDRVLNYYKFVMRIGCALNFGWGGASKLIYRVDADDFWMKNKKVRLLNKLIWMSKFFSNRIRGK